MTPMTLASTASRKNCRTRPNVREKPANRPPPHPTNRRLRALPSRARATSSRSPSTVAKASGASPVGGTRDVSRASTRKSIMPIAEPARPGGQADEGGLQQSEPLICRTNRGEETDHVKVPRSLCRTRCRGPLTRRSLGSVSRATSLVADRHGVATEQPLDRPERGAGTAERERHYYCLPRRQPGRLSRRLLRLSGDAQLRSPCRPASGAGSSRCVRAGKCRSRRRTRREWPLPDYQRR